MHPTSALLVHVSPATPPSTSTTVVRRPKLVKWRIVIDRSGKHYLYFSELDKSLSGPEVMRHIMTLYHQEAVSFATKCWHLFHIPVIDTVELEMVRSPAMPTKLSSVP